MKNIVKKVILPLVFASMFLFQAIPAFAAASPATLKVDGFDDREVISYSYSLDKATDEKGKVTGSAELTEFVIKVVPMENGNNQLQQWALSENDKRNAELEIYNTVSESVMKTIKMKDARCISQELKYSKEDGNYEEIRIVCSELENGSVKFENNVSQLTGTTVSNGSRQNQIIIICASVAVIAVIAVLIVVITKKKNKNK